MCQRCVVTWRLAINPTLHTGMTDKPKQATPPSYQPEEQTAETTEYREIPQDELWRILEQHRIWMETDGKHGMRADLENANLVEANLQEANLQKASFNGAILRGATLHDTDLTDATGLLANQLAGTNVSGATLPQYIQLSDGLEWYCQLNEDSTLNRQFAGT